jgi:hypothetical protein
MRKRLVFISTWALFVALLNTINPQQASAATTLTTCASLKSSVQYLAKDSKCNERIYESSTWYQSENIPTGTPGSKIISINTCQSKSRPDLILLRTKCNNKTQVTTTWHRPLGPPAAPSILRITAGVLGSATVATKAPTDNGGARITTFSLSANSTGVEGKTERASSTFNPNSSGEIKISGLTPGAIYTFTLVAHNAVGASASSQASTPFLAPTIPAVPSITAVIATGTNSALITYTAPVFDGGSPITSYTATSFPSGIKATTYRTTAGTIEVSGLVSSTSYTFSIVANNFAGSSLPSTISGAITTFSPPPPPPAVEAPAPAPAPTLAAPAFTLSSSSETRTANIVATGFTINSTGGTIASFAINATPAGMSFSTLTGALTGTPTSVATATAYTVTATNTTGSTTQTFTLTVEAALVAPAFTLSSSSETRTVNTVATGFTISSTGGLIASFAINATPAGMSFSTSTGALSGTPTSVATATAYTITATNATGSTTQIFTLTVEVAPALPAFTLSSSSETRGVNAQAAAFTVTSTGGAVASYSITPTPVTSMTFNTTTGKLSGWTGTVAGVTTYTVTATNSSGTATQTFVLTVTPGGANKVAISRASVGTAKGLSFTVQPQITIQDGYANTVTSSTAVVTATISAGGTLIGTTTATASSGVATFGNLGISGTVGTNYAVTYTVEGLTLARQSITVTDFAIGSIGPGGGRVFYIAATTFASPGSTCNTTGIGGISTCKYLEVSPSTWKTGSVASDLGYEWSTNISVSTGQNRTTSSAEGVVANSANEKFNWKIGQGFYNTSVMKVDGATSAAQAAVLAYEATDSSAGQWFIPSTNELNELCKYARGQTTGDLTVKCVAGSGTFKSTANAGSDLGGFVLGWYWTSSEWAVHPQGAWYQSFRDGSQEADGKANALFVRPIRAF